MRPTSLVAQKAEIDITKDLAMGTRRTVRVPVECKIGGLPATVILEVHLLKTMMYSY